MRTKQMVGMISEMKAYIAALKKAKELLHNDPSMSPKEAATAVKFGDNDHMLKELIKSVQIRDASMASPETGIPQQMTKESNDKSTVEMADAYSNWISGNKDKAGIWGGKSSESQLPKKPFEEAKVESSPVRTERVNMRKLINSLRTESKSGQYYGDDVKQAHVDVEARGKFADMLKTGKDLKNPYHPEKEPDHHESWERSHKWHNSPDNPKNQKKPHNESLMKKAARFADKASGAQIRRIQKKSDAAAADAERALEPHVSEPGNKKPWGVPAASDEAGNKLRARLDSLKDRSRAARRAEVGLPPETKHLSGKK